MFKITPLEIGLLPSHIILTKLLIKKNGRIDNRWWSKQVTCLMNNTNHFSFQFWNFNDNNKLTCL